ncbi:M4 family metallopeptidase [Pedobacter sp.]|jgi:Zn-dependent metalloprotease|uniref:M4 family metallopeptidase n=1 Tax=Pedobacter sp. TaxID=1411316 RepID=UPI002CA1E6E7|nr:M4 family metallopeptidase [Pedobacter sp.]HWW37872.1 M4 family metallopeptidase [Pedobacter sp.]
MKKLLLLLLCAGQYTGQLYAQDSTPTGDTAFIRRDKAGGIAQINFTQDMHLSRTLKDEVTLLNSILKARPGIDEYRFAKSKSDQRGYTHKKYDQYFHGVKVEGAQFITHSITSVESANGNIKTITSDFSVAPSISQDIALQTAINKVGAKRYSWQDLSAAKSQNNELAQQPVGELVITESSTPGIDTIALAWKFHIMATEPFSDELVYVDAQTGNVIASLDQVRSINAPGTGYTYYNGLRSIVTDSYGGGYRLYETRNSVILHTLDLGYNAATSANLAAAPEWTDNDNTWAQTEHGPEWDAISVHWGMEQVMDYWYANGRSGTNGSGGTPTAYAHWATPVNSGFISSLNVLVFGSPGAYGPYYFNPMTTLDCIGHETAHAIAYQEANLVYAKESGAIDEGLADFWAAVIESVKLPTASKWSMMEEAGTTPLRYINNPKASIVVPQPDTYNGLNYFATVGCTPSSGGSGNDGCGVHRNMSIISYALYVLSDGRSGTNDLGNAYNVTGIGITQTAAIVYYAEVNYLVSGSSFANFRDNMIQAARVLYGTGSCQEVSVTNAFYAVGVGPAYVLSGTMSTAPAGICSSATYSMTSVSPGASVSWSVAPTGSVTPSTGTGTSITLTRVGSSNATVNVTATITNACGGSTNVSKQVRVGLVNDPVPSAVAHPSTCGWNIKGTMNPTATAYQMSTDGGTTWITCPTAYNATLGATEYYVYQDVPGPATYTCKLRAVNSCGTTTAVTRSWTVARRSGDCLERRANPDANKDTTTADSKHEMPDQVKSVSNISLKVYPNPSTGQLTCDLSNAATTSKGLKEIKMIRVFSSAGVNYQVIRYPAKTTKATVDISKNPAGTYWIEISDDVQKETRKVILQK